MNENRKLNYYTDEDFIRYDCKAGVLRSPAGTRLVAVGEDFLRGFVAACEYETGSATPAVLRRCGLFFGKKLSQRFEIELSQFAGVSMRDRSMNEFNALVVDLWRGHGLGELLVDWTHGQKRFLPARLSDGPMQDIGPKGHTGDDLFAGVLEAFFGNFAEGALRCIQTGDVRLGDREGTTFILAVQDLEPQVGTLVKQRVAHSKIVEQLAA